MSDTCARIGLTTKVSDGDQPPLMLDQTKNLNGWSPFAGLPAESKNANTTSPTVSIGDDNPCSLSRRWRVLVQPASPSAISV